MTETLGSTPISTRLQRIANLAKQAPEMTITTLAHHMDVEFLQEAYRRTRKDGAPGVDGVTAEQYAANLEENLQRLLERAKSGTYRAPPVRRVHIPKGDGSKTRPIGIPTLEDKILQRAVAMLLEAVYEQDFLPFSYGFRPGRSAHQALGSLREAMVKMGGGWIIEVDIQGFFDALDHRHLQAILRQRVRDGVLLRLIGKWLNAGVLEGGTTQRSERGSPQGGVISPMLANVYLHEVFDKWVDEMVMPRMRGRVAVVRFADDIAMAFSCKDDADRVMRVLPKRFAKYGLTLHPEKTRMVDFNRPPSKGGDGRIPGRPGTFELLGFLHYWARSLKGFWVIKRKTAKDRFKRALRQVNEWCRRNRHLPILEQRMHLIRMLRGHAAYYGITGNARALTSFWHWMKAIWRKWLNRRSQRARMDWARFHRFLRRYPLPVPRAVHSIYHVANL